MRLANSDRPTDRPTDGRACDEKYPHVSLPLTLLQGIWKPQKIENPDYFEEPNPVERLTPIGAIGLELWTMSENVVFDNFILAEDIASVDK